MPLATCFRLRPTQTRWSVVEWSGWARCKQKKSQWVSLEDEMACLDCPLTKNRREVGSQGLLDLSTMSHGSTRRPVKEQKVAW